MEFPFRINDVLKKKVNKIGSNLLPEEFSGDHHSAKDCAAQISDVVDEMGLASAKAQGLKRAVTSSVRMRNFDYRVYLLIDPEGSSGKGTVIGLLKVGRKKLFVFDATGARHEVEPLCVLDFYVHESKQRMGCGKILYEHMLSEENTSPGHIAVDRPSDKFLGFLHKHYGLRKIIPQFNHFVLYEEFFRGKPEQNSQFSEHYSKSEPGPVNHNTDTRSLNNATLKQCNYQVQSFGRYAARKPPATMGELLQHPSVLTPQRSGTGFHHKLYYLEHIP